MAVDLSDLIESLEREINPPGTDNFPDATEAQLLGNLSDSFWEAKLYGFFDDYSESDGLVFPISGSTDLGREWQQLIVLFAGTRILRMKLMVTNTNFRAVAGPVEFEQSNSANLLKEILVQLQEKINIAYAQLGSLGNAADYYINGLVARTDSLVYGDEFYWG